LGDQVENGTVQGTTNSEKRNFESGSPAKPEQFLMSYFRTGIAPPALASFGWEHKPNELDTK
jgi:hypothetical protein